MGNVIKVAKVIEIKDDKVILEVGKDDNASYDVKEGDQFYTFVFVKHEVPGELRMYDPFVCEPAKIN